MEAHTFNHSRQIFVNLRLARSTEQVPGQSGLHRETLSQQNKTNKQQKHLVKALHLEDVTYTPIIPALWKLRQEDANV